MQTRSARKSSSHTTATCGTFSTCARRWLRSRTMPSAGKPSRRCKLDGAPREVLSGEQLAHEVRLEVAGVRPLDRLQRVRTEKHDIEIPPHGGLSLGLAVGHLCSLVVRTERLDGRAGRCE